MKKVPYSNWSPLPRWLIYGEKPAGTLEVFSYLQYLQILAESKKSLVQPRQTKIAAVTGISLRQVRIVLQWLEKKEVLARFQTKGRLGRGTDAYQLDWKRIHDLAKGKQVAADYADNCGKSCRQTRQTMPTNAAQSAERSIDVNQRDVTAVETCSSSCCEEGLAEPVPNGNNYNTTENSMSSSVSETKTKEVKAVIDLPTFSEGSVAKAGDGTVASFGRTLAGQGGMPAPLPLAPLSAQGLQPLTLKQPLAHKAQAGSQSAALLATLSASLSPAAQAALAAFSDPKPEPRAEANYLPQLPELISYTKNEFAKISIAPPDGFTTPLAKWLQFYFLKDVKAAIAIGLNKRKWSYILLVHFVRIVEDHLQEHAAEIKERQEEHAQKVKLAEGEYVEQLPEFYQPSAADKLDAIGLRIYYARQQEQNPNPEDLLQILCYEPQKVQEYWEAKGMDPREQISWAALQYIDSYLRTDWKGEYQARRASARDIYEILEENWSELLTEPRICTKLRELAELPIDKELAAIKKFKK
ncbi:MAG TPA: hypothetical protein VGP72_27035 [Planctomycetota bacterium]|jgi:hypothetical protein